MVSLRGLPLEAACPRIIVPLFARSLDPIPPLAMHPEPAPAAALGDRRLAPIPGPPRWRRGAA